MYNNMGDNLAVVAAIDPALVDDAAVTSDWVDMGKHDQVMFILNVGATDITVNAKLQSADDTSGTNNTDISGKAIAQIAADEDNSQWVITVRQDELNAGDVAVALVVTVGDGTAGAYISAVGVALSNAGPASDYDLASVDERVS